MGIPFGVLLALGFGLWAVPRQAAGAEENSAPTGVSAGPLAARDWTADFDVSRSSEDRLGAVQSTFQGRHPRASSALTKAFAREPRGEIRAWIVRAEDRLSPAKLPFLERALRDVDVQVREAAATALGQSGQIQAADDLAAQLSKEPDSGARITIAFWLGFLGGSRAVRALSQALVQDQDANVRLQAGQSLLRIKTPQALRAAQQASGDPDARVRGLAR